MSLTGSENTLKATLITEIENAILANTGFPVATPNAINSLAEGLANAVIPHFITNTIVTTAVAPHTPGGSAVGTGTLG